MTDEDGPCCSVVISDVELEDGVVGSSPGAHAHAHALPPPNDESQRQRRRRRHRQGRGKARKGDGEGTDGAAISTGAAVPPSYPTKRTSHEYVRVKSVMTAEPFASMTGRALFDLSESIDNLAALEPDPTDPPKPAMKRWWRNLYARFTHDVSTVQDLSPKKTMDRVATLLVMATHVKPSTIAAILLAVAAPSICVDGPVEGNEAHLIAQYKCLWE